MTIRRSAANRARRALQGDDRGIALPMVLTIFLVGFALIGAFLVAILGSAQVSSTTRAGIAAQAAAEAGIAAARVALPAASEANANFCTAFPGVSSSANPQYTVTGACDDNTNPSSITLTSTGTAPDGSTAKVQARFAVSAGSSVVVGGRQRSLVVGTGDISALKPVSGDPDLTLTLVLPDGDYDCWSWNAREISGDIIVPHGKAALGVPGCKVAGNLIASGTVAIQGGASVGGSVTAAGTGESTVQSSGKVTGSVNVNGPLNLNGANIGGSATAAGTGQSQIGNSTVAGSFTARGPVNAWGSNTVGGSILANDPSAPTVAISSKLLESTWYEYAFVESEWQAAGYVRKNSTCTVNDLKSIINGATAPIYIVCSNPLSLWPGLGTLSLKTDVALVTPGGSLVNAAPVIRSADGNPHQLSLITSDSNLNDKKPTCSSPATQLTLTGTVVQSPAIMAVYTPCAVEFGTGTIHGALVSGTINAWGGPTFAAFDVKVPGLTLAVDETGESVVPGGGVPTIDGGVSARPTSQRNID